VTVFLGVDVGTSAVKAVLVGADEAVLAEAETPLDVSRPRPNWSEQEPEDWWRAVEATLGKLRAARPKDYAATAAVGLSGQMHGAVCLDGADRPLRPAILWNDGRADAECRELESRVPGLGRIAGVGAMPGFTAPKLLWLERHEPEARAATAAVLLPKDYVRLRLTGERVTDMSDAAGTLWLDEARRDWSDEVLAATGLTRGHMPALVEGSASSGALRKEAAAALGLPPGLPVAGGGGDAAAGGVGIGAVGDGDAFLSLGTSGQLFVTTAAYRPAPESAVHAFAHAVPGRWFQMAAMLNGASALAWGARLLGAGIAPLLAEAEQGYPGPGRLLFLPYLTGERTPHNDPHARGVFFGLDAGTTRVEVTRAVLEGVVYSFMDAAAALTQAGTRIEGAAAIGGGSRSRFWLGLFADALQIPVTTYRGAEKGPAFGAARLARLAATGERVEAVAAKPAASEVIAPDPERGEAFREGFARFRDLYRRLRPAFRG